MKKLIYKRVRVIYHLHLVIFINFIFDRGSGKSRYIYCCGQYDMNWPSSVSNNGEPLSYRYVYFGNIIHDLMPNVWAWRFAAEVIRCNSICNIFRKVPKTNTLPPNNKIYALIYWNKSNTQAVMWWQVNITIDELGFVWFLIKALSQGDE